MTVSVVVTAAATSAVKGEDGEVVERRRGLYVSRTMASRVHGNLMSLPASVKPP